MSEHNTTVYGYPSLGLGIWWYVWGVKGFWWGVLYGLCWPIWVGYRLAQYLLG